MNDIYKDEMLQELAAFAGVNLERDLEVNSIQEMSDLYYAHEITGEKRVEIVNFLSQAKLPTQSENTSEFIKFIFKALKFNDSFYLQNLALIRATNSLRKEKYKFKVINSKLELKKEINKYMKKVHKSSGYFPRLRINDTIWKSFPVSITAASGDTMTIDYDEELSNVSLKIDFTKSYREFYKNGVRFKIYANFTLDKEYYAMVFNKEKSITMYSRIKDNEAIIGTDHPEDFRSGITISIYCKEDN